MNINPSQITPRDNGVGVNISQLNLAECSGEDIQYIQKLLDQYRLIIFSAQKLSDEQLDVFAAQLGPLFLPDKNFPVLGSQDAKSAVVIVGNQASEYAHAYLGHQEVLPHSDHQWLKEPSAASLLYAVDIQPGAAPTRWIDMIQAYSQLDTQLQQQIESLRLKTYNPFYRPFGSVRAHYVNPETEIPPGEVFSHPLVRTHPHSGEKILYLHLAYEMELEGLDYSTGSALIAQLHKHIQKLSCRYEHHWKNGDVVLWDNRATLHYRPAFGQEVRRVLKRITIAGETPY